MKRFRPAALSALAGLTAMSGVLVACMKGGADHEPSSASPTATMAKEEAGDKQAPGKAVRMAPAPGEEAAPDPLAGVPVVNGKPFADMYFKHYGVNPTIDTAEEAVSTFSIDVDTASYALTRSYLERSKLPEEAAVRVEEFINYFNYHYEAPTEAAFSVQAEAFPSPNRKGYHVLHIGLKGREVKAQERAPSNLVFVVDVSGSMARENRLGLVKRSLKLLVEQLDERDTVGLVVYGSTARKLLDPTDASRRQQILAAIDQLKPEGSTNAEAGIRVGYDLAAKHLIKDGVNRVILCSDGVANTGITGPDGILGTIKQQAAAGVTISTVGFGMGNYNDVMMERLADAGNGNYSYVDDEDQARRVFVENLTGTLQVIAKDVKLQLAFDKDAVSRYRLLGYENRTLDERDFDDDRVDAGEIGAGHAVTALYEVKLKPGHAKDAFGTLRIRYKAPKGTQSELIERPLPMTIVRQRLDDISAPARLSLVAAAFGEKLRGSYWVRNLSWQDILAQLDAIDAQLMAQPEVAELRGLILRAQTLDQRGDKYAQVLPLDQMDFDRVPVLQ